MNRTLKEASVQRFYYEIHQHFGQHLTDFVSAIQLRSKAQNPPLRDTLPQDHV